MDAMPSPVSRRLLRGGIVAVVVLLMLAGGVAAYVLLHAPGNVSNPGVAFTAPTSTQASTPPPSNQPKPRRLVDKFQWPWYGFDAGRTRFFADSPRLHPPFHVGWTYVDGALLEFPPVIYHEKLFLLDDNGGAQAIDARTGRVLWHDSVGTLAAASPALAGAAGLVLLPVLSDHGKRPGGGSFVALSMKNGHVVWRHQLPAGSESSPIVHGRTVYFGDQGGRLWALAVRTGHVYWTFHASGAIKGGPALVNGVLYFGDYAGRAYAVSAVTGRQIWAVGTNGARFGFGSGQFYATPAVAYGRVYMGNTDGRMYSFGVHNGALGWATGTGAYVYASASVADPPGLGPTVYVGSYDGSLYAFNAKSGAIRWRHPAGGKISGSSTVIGNVVYYSDLGTRTTTGLDATTGHKVFSFPDGAFTPVIADHQAIYLDGYSNVYQLLPGPKPAVVAAHRHRPQARARKPSRHHTRRASHRRHRHRQRHTRHRHRHARHAKRQAARHAARRTHKAHTE
jgi:outer membrane protein assembly factor BamB